MNIKPLKDIKDSNWQPSTIDDSSKRKKVKGKINIF